MSFDHLKRFVSVWLAIGGEIPNIVILRWFLNQVEILYRKIGAFQFIRKLVCVRPLVFICDLDIDLGACLLLCAVGAVLILFRIRSYVLH